MPYPGFLRRAPAAPASILDHRGNLKVVSFGPSAGNTVIRVPGNVLWRLCSLTFSATAAGATFWPAMHFRDASGNDYAVFGTVQSVPGGATAFIGFAALSESAEVGANAVVCGSCGRDAFLVPGASILLTFAFSVPAPAFAAGQLLVEEWVVN